MTMIDEGIFSIMHKRLQLFSLAVLKLNFI